jgi:hypothetical protein
MELEGEHLQIRWKPAQKKNTKNQIVIYGIPPVFDAAGIMGELLHGLKESEKKICNPGSTLSLEERNHRRDLELPLFNGFFKQATPPKAVSPLGREGDFSQQEQGIHSEWLPRIQPRVQSK